MEILVTNYVLVLIEEHILLETDFYLAMCLQMSIEARENSSHFY